MTLALAACGSTAPAAPAAPEASAGAPAAEETSAPEAGAVKDGERVVAENPEDWPKVVVEVCSFTDTQEHEQEIEDALNEYLVSINAGVQCDMLPIAIGDRATQLTLMLTDPDNPIDVFGWRWYSTVVNMYKNGQVICLDKYKDVYPELWEIYPEDIYRICQVNGELYSMPSGGCFGQQDVYVLRKDIAEEIGVMDLVDTKITVEQLEDIMAKAEAAHPEMCWQGDTALLPFMGIDNLGDDKWLGSLVNRGLDETEIVNIYDTELFHDYVTMCKDWADKGYLVDDPLNNSYAGTTLVNDGIGGGYMFEAFDMEYAYTLMQQQIPQYEMVVFQLTDWVGTNSCVYNGWNISAVCKNPDAAMKMLYLMYTDENVLRYFSLGIEDLTYVMHEDGAAYYPEGKDMNTNGWNCSAVWFYPNETLSIPFETTYLTMYDDMKAINQDPDRKYSNAMGFIFDDTAVFDQVKACDAIVDEYREALMMGQVDVESSLESFRSELKAAGIDEIIAAMQEQYDAFLASK